MKYFHRSSVPTGDVLAHAAVFFGPRLAPAGVMPHRRSFSGSLGTLHVDVVAEGGHYTLVTITTDQPAESELDRLGKRFLGEVHCLAEPAHELRGSY